MINSLDNDELNPLARDYLRTKHIDKLFQAIMIGLIVVQPDDPIEFIRKCLDKFEHNEEFIDRFYFTRLTQMKYSTIDDRHRIIFILSSSGLLKLSSRLLDHYDNLTFISINNDDDDQSENNPFDRVSLMINDEQKINDDLLVIGHLNQLESVDKWRVSNLNKSLVIVINQIQVEDRSDLHQINVNDDFQTIFEETISIINSFIDCH